MRRTWLSIALAAAFVALALPLLPAEASDEKRHVWNPDERSVLKSLSLEALPPPPRDPTNRWADDPAAAALGERLFFDVRLSGNQEVSCGTCHRTDYSFTDTLPLAHGMGTTSRRTMPMIGMAYQPWFFWDGRKDSLWSQALGPIESPVEHGFTRTLCYTVIRDSYRVEYESIFGSLPDIEISRKALKARPASDDASALKAWVNLTAASKEAVNSVYVNMGKAIGAYGRTILPGPSRFDAYVEALLSDDGVAMEKTLNPQEVAGLRLFIGRAKCTSCHNGPLFTNGDFHDIGLGERSAGPADRGRSAGILAVLSDEFNCLSEHSDARPEECAELRFIDTSTQKYEGAFKTPTLRNVAVRGPYMHAGQFRTLLEVLEFYREVSRGHEHGEGLGHADIEHADLSDEELRQIEAFLHTLTGEIVAGTGGAR